MNFAKRIVGLIAMLAVTSCSGGGQSSSSVPVVPVTIVVPPPAATATLTAPTANVATLTLDAGPSALASDPGPSSAFNIPYVTVTLCAPGSTSNCQTIDHVLLDTGSIGLRILRPVLNAGLASALPTEMDASNNPVGECYQYVNSFAFGSVRFADFSIVGEKVSNMPLQLVGDSGAFASIPSSCSSGGGDPILTVKDFSANGILGVGTTTTDCGSICTVSGGSSAATYYSCPASGCSSIISRAASATAPFQQLPNPVAAFPIDNNGTIVSLPTVDSRGITFVSGTITFGIGTQANNALDSVTVLPVTTSGSRLGPGVLTATYNGKQLTRSFLDSGSNEYLFIDTSLPACTATDLMVFYCPTSPTLLSPVLTGTNGATASAAFTLYSPLNVSGSANAAPGLGINPTLVKPPLAFANSFDFGIPFFFGRRVYTAIEGRSTGSVNGPYFAF